MDTTEATTNFSVPSSPSSDLRATGIVRNLTETTFVVPPNRDAWGTIRGFVYQADLTIERWLYLQPEQELYLESGEDIDTVTAFLQNHDMNRLLEQVKYRQTNVTLKSSSALAALANAVEHRRLNPGTQILFRFTTNAQSGKEQLSPFAGNSSGIEVWERLRAAEAGTIKLAPSPEEAEQEAARLRVGLRQILASTQTCPSDVSDRLWSQFHNTVQNSTEEEFNSFIVGFEWSMGNPDADEMSDRIQQTLLEQGYAPDGATAYSQYQRLFLHVLKTLSQRTGKQLTHHSLVNTLTLPLSETDQKFFEIFLGQMGLLDKKLAFMQAQMAQQVQMLSTILEQVNRVVDLSQMHTLTLAAPIPIFEPPPVGEGIVLRSETVTVLKGVLDGKTWLALTGGSGIGKSHLALLLIARHKQCPIWLRLRDQSVPQAAAIIDTAFLYLNRGVLPASRKEMFVDVCRQFQAGTVLVVDDLPDMIDGDLLVQRLELLYQACYETGVQLISTSVNRLPGSLLRVTRDQAVVKEVPFLSEIDALQLLQAFGAPKILCDDLKLVRLLNNVAGRHPALLTAMAIYLRDRNWQWTSHELGVLFEGGYAEEVNQSTIRRLLNTVTDEQSRNLLYRLNLVLGSFNLETVRRLAEVEPVVTVVRERLLVLTGLWVQRETNEKMQVSPLLRVLGSDDLPAATQAQCRVALAKATLEHETITLSDITTAITYYAAAKEYEQSALLLIFGLSSLRDALKSGQMTAEQAQKTGLQGILWDMPVPPTVSQNTCILLRAHQIPLAEVLGKDSAYLIRDLMRLVNMAEITDGTGLLAAASFAASHISKINFAASCSLVEKAALFIGDAKLADGNPVTLPKGFTAGSLVWVNLEGVRRKEHVISFCEMIGRLPNDIRHKALDDGLFSDQAASLLMDRFWLTEEERPVELQNWERMLADMDDIVIKTKEVDAELLVANAIRAQILILCEKIQEPDRAVSIANAALDELSDNPRIRFLICDALGQKLSYVLGREQEAQTWLERAEAACNQIPHALRRERAMTLLALARLAEKRRSPEEAVKFISRGVDLVRSSDFYPEVELVKFLGELALAEWNAGNQRAAYVAMDDAASRLLNLKKQTPEWSALFNILGHTVGYMSGTINFGIPPKSEDGQDYVLPPIGNFHFMKTGPLADAYRVERDILLPSVMAQYAAAMHDDDRYGYWLERAILMGREIPAAAMVVAHSVINTLPELASSGHYAELFDGAREAAFTTVADECLSRRGERDSLFQAMDVSEILGKTGSNDWNDAERRALALTLIPLSLHLGKLAVEARTSELQRENLLHLGRLAINLCHEVAAVSSISQNWDEAAFIIETCYLGIPVFSTIMERAKRYDTHSEPVQALAYLSATMQPSLDLREACRAHLGAIPYCLGNMPTYTGYRLLLLPFIQAFWGSAIERRSISFSPPALIKREFAEALSSPTAFQAKRIMLTVANGLGVRHEKGVTVGFNRWDAYEARHSL